MGNTDKKSLKVIFVLFLSFMLFVKLHAQETDILYADSPAHNWHEAFPLGNGRLGAMVYGGVFHERIQTNEDTFWAGGPRQLQKKDTYPYIIKIRKLIDSNQTSEAENLIDSKILGPYYHSYLPFVDINIDFEIKGEITDYKRTLDLSTGILTVKYKVNGITYKREYFTSYPDQTLLVKITSDEKCVNLNTFLSSKLKNRISVADKTLSITGQAPEIIWPHYEKNNEILYSDTCGMHFQANLFVKECDGIVRYDNDKIDISNAKQVILGYVASTSFNGFDKDPVKDGKNYKEICSKSQIEINKTPYESLKKRHTDDFNNLYSRVSINLGNSERDSWPLNDRIKYYESDKDPALTALYFNFGRYLLISSSRPGTQPANLQGIWCDDLQSAWSCNYTLNCNVEINYWAVESTNLSECHLPLFNMIKEATKDGKITAKTLYNSKGWTVHHNLDIWRTTWPVGKSGQWGIYQAAPAWLCEHIWRHYEYTKDKEFLKEYLPIMEGAAEFYLGTLQETENGNLVTNPAVSFENTYKKPDGTRGWACRGPSADMQMIYSLFNNILEANKELNHKSNLYYKIRKAINRLKPININPRTGELNEWYEDWDNFNNSNGMVAQGWGAVASDLISLEATPKYAEAFRKTLEIRKPMYASNSGSWTGAFAAGWWARLEEADSLQKTIDRHFQKALYPNLTSQFHSYFQIDGNLGFTSAICEMLLQNNNNEINILPALPRKYPNGYVKGLKVKGNHTLDIEWADLKLKYVTITAGTNDCVTVKYKNKVYKANLSKGDKITLNDIMLNI